MFTPDSILSGLLIAAFLSTVAFAQTTQDHYGLGTNVDPQDLVKYVTVQADGRGLPAGSGNATAGAKVYADTCAACHGDKLEGNPAKGIGGDRLTGGRGSLATVTPIKTVESYWPYATTLFDYVKRAMPFNAPGTLSDNDVYAVVAFILSEAKIIKASDTINAETLPKVMMPCSFPTRVPNWSFIADEATRLLHMSVLAAQTQVPRCPPCGRSWGIGGSDSDIVKLTLWTHSRLSGRPFQNFNFAVVDVLGDLGEIAHVERAGRALHEVIGVIFCDAICVDPGLRH